MLRRLLYSIAALLIGVAGYLWYSLGPVNGPRQAPPRDTWEALIRERIKVPAGYSLEVFARGLGSPRLMQMTAGGDILVSGFRDGTLLLVKADKDGDGRSDGTVTLAQDLDQPHGLLLEGRALHVAEEQRVVAYDFDGAAIGKRRVILDGLPTGGNHSSRTLKRGPDGWFYLSIGSSCNSCVEDHPWRAALLRFREGERPEIFAQGLRNTVGFDWEPGSGRLYGVDNGRDSLGDDTPDDEVNLIAQGRHYGWPYVHGADLADPKLHGSAPAGFEPQPQFHGLGAHVAPLALRFTGPGEALVSEHGSWNRSIKSGYRIVRLSFTATGASESPFLSGCEENDEVICRPVDIVQAADGSLFVSDDYAGAIYRVARQP